MVTQPRSLMAVLLLGILIACSTTNTTRIETPSFLPVSQTENGGRQPGFTVEVSTPSPSATLDISKTAFFQAQTATQSVITQFPSVCTDPSSIQDFSPNGLWMAELCYSQEEDSLIMTLSNRETQKLWKVVYRDYKQRAGTLFDEGFRVVNWSSDDRYAYISVFFSGDGGECFSIMSQKQHGEGLFRLNLQTGSVTTVLPIRDIGYDFSFSSTGRRLVYETYSPGLKIFDLQTGELIDAGSRRQFESTGNYIWSPDGLQFVYSKAEYTDQWEVVDYSLWAEDGKTGKGQIILESQQNCLAAETWKGDHVINVARFDSNDKITVIEYDLRRKQVLRESTATPAP